VAVGALGLWSAVLWLVPSAEYGWSAVPYFIVSGLVGTAAGRFFRIAAIERVGASVSASIVNLNPFISTGLAILVLGERVTPAILAGTAVIVAGTTLLSLSGRQVGFAPRDLVYPFTAATCFGVVQIIRKLGLAHAGPLFTAAINTTTALVAATAFLLASGRGDAFACDRRSVVYFVVGGLAENAGVFLIFAALGFGDVSVVTPLVGTAPLFVLLLSVMLPGRLERLPRRVVVGAILVVAGVFVLTGSPRTLGW
jgi:uncharacterized membrane protein